MYGMFMSVGSQKQRSVYGAEHRPFWDITLPGKLVRSEGQPP